MTMVFFLYGTSTSGLYRVVKRLVLDAMIHYIVMRKGGIPRYACGSNTCSREWVGRLQQQLECLRMFLPKRKAEEGYL